MPIAIATLVMLFTVQPMQGPKPDRVPERSSAQIASQNEHSAETESNPPKQPSSTGNATSLQKQQPKTMSNNAHGDEANEEAKIQGRLEIFTGLLVIVGFLQVIVLIWQSYIFLRTLKISHLQVRIYERQRIQMVKAGEQTERIIAQMQDTARRQLRAYMLVDSALVKFPSPTVPEAQVHFKNFGQTPAYDFRGWIGIYVGAYPLSVQLPPAPSNLRTGKEPIGPGRTSAHALRSNPLPNNVAPFIGTTSHTIWAYGVMTYKDAFGNPRFLEYRLVCGGPDGMRAMYDPNGVIKGYLMTADVEGNNAD